MQFDEIRIIKCVTHIQECSVDLKYYISCTKENGKCNFSQLLQYLIFQHVFCFAFIGVQRDL